MITGYLVDSCNILRDIAPGYAMVKHSFIVVNDLAMKTLLAFFIKICTNIQRQIELMFLLDLTGFIKLTD